MKVEDQEYLYLSMKKAMEHEDAMIIRAKSFRKNIKDNRLGGLLDQCQKVSENHIKMLKKYWSELNIEAITKRNMSLDNLDQLEEIQKQLNKNETFYNEAILNILNPLVRDMMRKFIEDELKLYFEVQEEAENIKHMPKNLTLGVH